MNDFEKNLFDYIPNVAIRCNKSGVVLDVYTTQNIQETKPYKRFKGKNIANIFPKEFYKVLEPKVNKVISKFKKQVFEYKFNPNLEFAFVEVLILPNSSKEFLISFYDISEEKKAKSEMKKFVEELHYNKIISEQKSKELALVNNKLNQSEKELRKINANKDKFFSIISHDLRSPFTSLIGFSEFLASEVDDLSKEEIKEFSQNIFKSARGTFALLENLLQWSRIQTGNIEFAPSQYCLDEHINRLIELYQVTALRKKIKVKAYVEKDLKIYADQNMVETILRNLLSNAIKFTPRGGQITIFAKNMSKMVEIKVVDSGVGMNKATQSKLFKIGENVSTQGTEQERGTGLGLILCKEFVETNGGKLSLKSSLNKGTTFRFTLPKTGNGKIFNNISVLKGTAKSTNLYKFSK